MTPETLHVTQAISELNHNVFVLVLPVILLLLLAVTLFKLIHWIFLAIDAPISRKPDSPFKVPFYRPMQVHVPRSHFESQIFSDEPPVFDRYEDEGLLSSGKVLVQCSHCGQWKAWGMYMNHQPICNDCVPD